MTSPSSGLLSVGMFLELLQAATASMASPVIASSTVSEALRTLGMGLVSEVSVPQTVLPPLSLGDDLRVSAPPIGPSGTGFPATVPVGPLDPQFLQQIVAAVVVELHRQQLPPPAPAAFGTALSMFGLRAGMSVAGGLGCLLEPGGLSQPTKVLFPGLTQLSKGWPRC